jgi:hypothetical protein
LHAGTRSTAPTLARALEATFKRRSSAFPNGVPPGLSDEFVHDPAKRAQWTAFAKKLRLLRTSRFSLDEAIARIRRFLLPVAEALAAKTVWAQKWPAGGPWAEHRERFRDLFKGPAKPKDRGHGRGGGHER